MFIPNISASDAKFENPLGDPESILLRGSQLKNELIWPRRLGCRWGCYRFGCSTSCNSGTSVMNELTIGGEDIMPKNLICILQFEQSCGWLVKGGCYWLHFLRNKRYSLRLRALLYAIMRARGPKYLFWTA